jgi:hypothetical protein
VDRRGGGGMGHGATIPFLCVHMIMSMQPPRSNELELKVQGGIIAGFYGTYM